VAVLDLPARLAPPEPARSMLHAALDPIDDALRAWERARREVSLDLEGPRSEARRLLPLVAVHLRGHLSDAEQAQLDAHHARTQAANEARSRVAADWVRRLDERGIRSCLLKGLPLARRDYRDLGARPMADIDILVPIERADEVLDLAAASGWREVGGVSRRLLWQLHHGSGMIHPDHGQLDVHWQLAGFLVDRRDEARSTDAFWSSAEPFELHGVRTATLDRTDTLVHTCLHGLWSGSNARARWVADAVTLLRASAGGEIDADRVVSHAERFEVGPLLHAALLHLVVEHDAPLPAGLLEELANRRPRRAVRRRTRAVLARDDGRELVRGLAHLRAYWAYTRWGWPTSRAVRTAPAFLAHLWGLERPRQIPRAILTRGPRRVRLRPSTRSSD
jgi:hypothetical protein